MSSRGVSNTTLRDAAMRSDSEAGSDVDAEMVGGDMSDGEKSVKDTSKKKKPEWDAKKQRHKTWLWRYLGYADATGGGPTARGKDRWKLSSSDAKVMGRPTVSLTREQAPRGASRRRSTAHAETCC